MISRPACLFLSALVAYPQQPEDAPSIKVDVSIVNVLFSVRDKKRGLVGNLEKSDFTVFEDSKQQEIKYFTRETDLPLTMGLLVDVSLSQERLIEEERRAAHQFLTKVLRPKDMAFIISFGAEAELLQDYTNSSKLLRNGLDQLRLNAGVGGVHPGPVPTASRQKGTILFDATYLAATEKLRAEVGRKAIILITDGADFGSSYTRDQAIEAAQKSDTIIYGIYYVDQRMSRGGGFYGGDEGTLKRMSEETGGRTFHVDRKNSLDSIFQEIQDELRSQYAIGYVSANTAKDGGYRKLEIKTKDKDQKVQARKGYYAVK